MATTSSALIFLAYTCILFSSLTTTTVIAQPQSSPVSYYILAIQYAKAVCSVPKTSCIPSIPNTPTIHGLWANTDKDNDPPVRNPADEFDKNKFQTLVPDMETKWPSVLTMKSNEGFWKHEWIKHGRRSHFDQKTFFEKTLEAYAFVNLMNKVKPGSYTMQAIHLQLSTAYGGAVTTVCGPNSSSPGSFAITEFRFNITFDSADNPQVKASKTITR